MMDDGEMDPTFGGFPTGPQKIMGPEDDEFLSDEEQSDDHGPFADLDQLRGRPAHMAVLLQYVLTQLEPNALLFHLCVEAAQHSKESKKLMTEIYYTFLDRHAPLKIPVAEDLISAVEECRSRAGSLLEESVRRAVDAAHSSALDTARSQLDDYRRTREMGLGTMFGETMLPPVPNPVKEALLAENSLAKIGGMIEADEEKREVILAAVAVYMRSTGVTVPSSLAHSLPDGTDKRKRSVFAMKKVQTQKREKDKDDKKGTGRQSLFREYILRPGSRASDGLHGAHRGDHEAVHGGGGGGSGGSVANMVRHFDPALAGGGHDGGALDSGAAGDLGETRGAGGRESGGSRVGRSESLRALDAGRRSPGSATSRSKSDIDREAALEATGRLGPPLTPTPRTPGDVTPPRTPRIWRRPEEAAFPSGSLASSLAAGGGGGGPVAPGDDEVLGPDEDLEVEAEAPHWQQLLKPEQLARLGKQEVKRQDVINELLHTERAHVRMLKVLKVLFCDRLISHGVAPESDVRQIFTNLDTLLPLHESLNGDMKKLKEHGPLVDGVGDVLLARFAGPPGEALQAAASIFCSQQSLALDMIKQRQRKDPRFQQFIQDAESNPYCRRLQLKDFLPCEMQRLTKYPLLLDKITKYTADSSPEHGKVQQASDCCKRILLSVNTAVREAENAQRLQDYQRRMDISPFLEKTQYPYIAEFKNLDLTKRKMLHEGPLTWRLNKEKTIDLHVLLLEDLVVLLQRQEEKFVLRCHSQYLGGGSDTKQIYSPIVKLGTVLLRDVARDKHAFFMISTSQLGPQIYELVAVSVSERRAWWQRLSDAVAGARKKSSTLLGLSMAPGDAPVSPGLDSQKDGAPGGEADDLAGGGAATDAVPAPPASATAGDPPIGGGPDWSGPSPPHPDNGFSSPLSPPSASAWGAAAAAAEEEDPGEESLAAPALQAVLRLMEGLRRLGPSMGEGALGEGALGEGALGEGALGEGSPGGDGETPELHINEEGAQDEGSQPLSALATHLLRDVALIQYSLERLQKVEAEYRLMKPQVSLSPKASVLYRETGPHTGQDD